MHCTTRGPSEYCRPITGASLKRFRGLLRLGEIEDCESCVQCIPYANAKSKTDATSTCPLNQLVAGLEIYRNVPGAHDGTRYMYRNRSLPGPEASDLPQAREIDCGLRRALALHRLNTRGQRCLKTKPKAEPQCRNLSWPGDGGPTSPW